VSKSPIFYSQNEKLGRWSLTTTWRNNDLTVVMEAVITCRYIGGEDNLETTALWCLLMRSRRLAARVFTTVQQWGFGWRSPYFGRLRDKLHRFWASGLDEHMWKRRSYEFSWLYQTGHDDWKDRWRRAEISEVVLRGLEPHCVLKLAVGEAVETVARVCVTEDSLLGSKSLR
jgi:hypothetical protein